MPLFLAGGHGRGGSHRPFAKLSKLKQSVSKQEPTPPEPEHEPEPEPEPEPEQESANEAEASDEQQFLQAIAGTSEMTASRERTGAAKPSPRVKPSDDSEVLAELADLCDGNGTFSIADSDEYIEGIAPGIDRRLLKRLRAGEYALQAHLDLHGMTQDEARKRVARFVIESRSAQRRCVLIVHGRGRHSAEQVPILKRKLRVWLQRGEIARSVLAFATARPSDGGAGAVYVLLRK